VYARAGLDLIIDVNGYFDAGAAGPTGPTGPSGPSGPTGAQGPAGSSNIVQVISNFSAAPGIFYAARMTCLAPTLRVVGGGVFIGESPGVPGSSDLTYMQYSFPLGTSEWEIRLKNDGTTYTNPVTAYAICVQ
jgi:hypothetical protein